MRAAALARDGVDPLDVVGAHLVERLVGERDDVALPDAWLQVVGDDLVHAVDHRRRHVEEHDLVDVLDLPRVEHRLLPVAHLETCLAQREHQRKLGDVQADGHPRHPLLLEAGFDLLGCPLEQARLGRDRAAQPDHACQAVVARQPGRVEPVMDGGGSEVPQVRLPVPGEQREAAHLVARPFADDRAGQVADVVVVEAEHRAELRAGERLAGAREPVVVQAAEVDALLEVDRGMAVRGDLAAPVVPRLQGLGVGHLIARDGLRLAPVVGHGCTLLPSPGPLAANVCRAFHSTAAGSGQTALTARSRADTIPRNRLHPPPPPGRPPWPSSASATSIRTPSPTRR